MIELNVIDDGILVRVQARAKGKRNAITGVHDGRLKVSVTQAPENGKANTAIAKVIAKTLGLKRSQVSLHTGGTNPRKEFLVTDISIGELRAILEAVTDGVA